MICSSGETVITNDGATILQQLQLTYPTAKMMAELGKAQDVEAGDGTTTVVVLAGSLLGACQALLAKGIHPTVIASTFTKCCAKAQEVLQSVSVPLELNDRESLLKSAVTSLNSKAYFPCFILVICEVGITVLFFTSPNCC